MIGFILFYLVGYFILGCVTTRALFVRFRSGEEVTSDIDEDKRFAATAGALWPLFLIGLSIWGIWTAFDRVIFREVPQDRERRAAKQVAAAEKIVETWPQRPDSPYLRSRTHVRDYR